MNTYLSTMVHTTPTWSKMNNLGVKQNLGYLKQTISVVKFAKFANDTFAEDPLSKKSIVMISLVTGSLQFMGVGHHIEKAVQVGHIALTIYCLVFGDNTKRLAIQSVAILSIANRTGCINENLVNFYNRFYYLPSALSSSISKDTGSIQKSTLIINIAKGALIHAVVNFCDNYDSFSQAIASAHF